MQFQMPSELARFVENEVASGRFPSEEDVLLAGVRLLKRDRDEAIAGIKQGLAEWERGEGTPLDEAFAKVRSKYGISEDA